MFQYLLAFFLINSCYRSFGIPTPKNNSISLSLVNLATQCENPFLSNAIHSKTKECNVLAPPYLETQIRCLIFYDINKQLCEAVAASKIAITKDVEAKLSTERDMTSVCTLAQQWVFTNLTEYDTYRNTSQNYFKNLVTCGEICSVAGVINAVNEYCKYYEWGLELLKGQVPTSNEISNNIIVDAPSKQEPDSNVQPEKVAVVSKPVTTVVSEMKTVDGQIKQTDSAVLNPTPVKSGEDIEVSKSTTLTSSNKQTAHQESAPTVDKNIEAGVDALEHPILLEANPNEQANKSIVTNEMKQTGEENDPALLPETGKDAPSLDSKGVDPVDGKGPSVDDYSDSNGNDGIDDDDEDQQGMDIKSEKKPETFLNNKPIVGQESDVSHKEFYPNPVSDSYSDDGDNFFPFFLTAIILVVLLYVLYHNKSKVSKVFFGLILEGRQGGRRRNSRGHAYRRLDTLEQAMSANTAAPPSKIIY